MVPRDDHAAAASRHALIDAKSGGYAGFGAFGGETLAVVVTADAADEEDVVGR